jgi:hypothetical protein
MSRRGGEGREEGLVRHKELINEINSRRIPHVTNWCISVFDIAILIQNKKINVSCFKNSTGFMRGWDISGNN